jgi:hypothetical protein
MKIQIDKKYRGAIFLAIWFIIIFIIQAIVGHNVDVNLKKYGAVVNGVVTRIDVGRGPAFVQVRYNFKGKYINNELQTNKPDTFKVGEKFKLLISGKDPDWYIRSLGSY